MTCEEWDEGHPSGLNPRGVGADRGVWGRMGGAHTILGVKNWLAKDWKDLKQRLEAKT